MFHKAAAHTHCSDCGERVLRTFQVFGRSQYNFGRIFLVLALFVVFLPPKDAHCNSTATPSIRREQQAIITLILCSNSRGGSAANDPRRTIRARREAQWFLLLLSISLCFQSAIWPWHQRAFQLRRLRLESWAAGRTRRNRRRIRLPSYANPCR